MMTLSLTSRIVGAALLAAFIVVPIAAQRAGTPEMLLRDALHKQQVEGDLPGAIRIYEQIVAVKDGNRAVRARALLELAGCYEKLGRQAATIYQQILRDFGDQPAATQAKARLDALRPPAAPPTMTLRKIDLGEDVQNVVAGDGQQVIYWDTQRTTLYSGDVSGKERRIVLKTDRAPRVFVSRDLSLVFLIYPPSVEGPISFAVVRADGTGYRPLTLSEGGKPLQFSGIASSTASWSWDNRFVVVSNPEGNTGRLLRVSVETGEVRDLLRGRTAGGNSPVAFSPDGRYVAYDLGYPYGIGVVATESGETSVAATDAYFVDWTRDGRYLLVGDTSATTMSLSAVGVSDGKPTGERIALRAVPVGQVRSLTNGALFLTGRAGGGRVLSLGMRASGAADVTWKRLDVIGSPVPYSNMSWTPDGRKFAYMSRELQTTAFVARVHDLTTGDDRELYRSTLLGSCSLGRVSAQLFCSQALSATGMEIISIALDTREVKKVASLDRRFVIERIRPDDKGADIVDTQKTVWYEWDFESGRLTELGGYVSDGRRLEFGVVSEPRNRGRMQVRPVGGAEDSWKALVASRLPPPTVIDGIPIKFSPDGQWIVYHDRGSDGRDGLYRVSTEGGNAAERLGDYPTTTNGSLLSVGPDGDRFLVNAPPVNRPELWLLENFLPPANSTARPGSRATR